jgi:zona occludens toxin
MPIKAYVGQPRHGKTYEVVVYVVLSALRQGRRVVSNIAGLNYDAMCQMLFAEGLTEDKIGKLVCVTHKEIENPFFWRTDEDPDDVETFIQLGDLIALDEIWRFWKKRGDIHPRAMNFFRMHGHMPHPKTGLICEIALISQATRDINENIRAVIEETILMVKNTKLGMDDSYVAHIFQRDSTAKRDLIRTLAPRKYNSVFFNLYKSHSKKMEGAAEPLEKNPDKRGNIFHGALFKFGIPFSLFLILPAGYFLYRFFHPAIKEKIDDPKVVASSVVVGSVPIRSIPEVSDSWQLVGHFIKNGSMNFIIKNSAGKIRQLVDPPNYKIAGLSVSVELPEGGFVTSWASVQQSKGSIFP